MDHSEGGRSAKANLEANKIAAASSFAQRVPDYFNMFKMHLRDVTYGFKPNIKQHDGRYVEIRPPGDDPNRFLEYVVEVRRRGLSPQQLLWDEHAIDNYIQLFEEFKLKAKDTDNQVYLSGPWIEIGIWLSDKTNYK